MLAALVIVPVVGLTTKVVVEGVTSWTYTIHWFETVPVLVVALAVALNGQWNQRARQGSSQR
ncbi:MAG: hypothetical protein R3185_02885 [Candidatus Thermoplasmatota archaeon]|nr:hypothetical protein [Candidatus Thermoplasmatota archaeon]